MSVSLPTVMLADLVQPTAIAEISVPGVAIVDFGATSCSEASVAVSGQDTILSTSHARAWFKGGTTVDNDMKAHMAAAHFCTLTVGGVTPGVGFNITARSPDALFSGAFNVHWVWNR